MDVHVVAPGAVVVEFEDVDLRGCPPDRPGADPDSLDSKPVDRESPRSWAPKQWPVTEEKQKTRFRPERVRMSRPSR